jgi:hypothetical protein
MNRITITRIGIFSLAKINATICAALGLIAGSVYGLIMLFVGSTLATLGGHNDGIGAAAGGIGLGMVGGLFVFVFAVVFYAFFGFIGGAISALIYNLVARAIGGLEIEFEGGAPEYLAPPPGPPQWAPNI